MTPGLFTFGIAAFVAAVFAPVVAMAARRLHIVDHPDGHRKLHDQVVPLAGGPTILLSVGAAIYGTAAVFPELLVPSFGDRQFLICLAASSLTILIVGVLDDRFKLRGRQKLAGQIVSALVMIPSGIMLERITLFGTTIELGIFAPLVMIFWILGAINALNLIDGVDGLASTTGIVLSLSVAMVSMILGGRPDGLLVSLSLAGSLTGFLLYNFPPARMFLGDSGSMLIGLLLGCVALKCSMKQYAAVALVMPTAIWSIPIFDVAMAIVRRRLTGRSIYTTDRGHLHHCLTRRGHTGSRLLFVVGSLCSLTGLGAVAAAAFQSEWLAVAAVLTAILLLVVTRTFGHTELKLLTNRARRFAETLVRSAAGEKLVLHDEQLQLQGQHEWEVLWVILTDLARQKQLDGVELMINLPFAGEEFHATWRSRSKIEDQEAWRTELPLLVDGIVAGHLRLVATANRSDFNDWLQDVFKSLQPFQCRLREVVIAMSSSFQVRRELRTGDRSRLMAAAVAEEVLQ